MAFEVENQRYSVELFTKVVIGSLNDARLGFYPLRHCPSPPADVRGSQPSENSLIMS
jgi:hypothetical protein